MFGFLEKIWHKNDNESSGGKEMAESDHSKFEEALAGDGVEAERAAEVGVESESEGGGAIDQVKTKIKNAKASTSGDDEHKDIARHLSEVSSAEDRVNLLLEVAKRDPFRAVRAARELDDNYTLDRFHGLLHEEHVLSLLRNSGALKE